MPKQRSKEEMRLYQRERRKGVTPTVTPATVDDIDSGVTPVVISNLPPEWAHVVEFISRPTRAGDISNLEKLQRISGSLGKLGSHVWMGSLNLEEIGRGIGVKQPPALTEKRGLTNA